ncbi:peptidoglycan DD-metalloendopeptidase family protein [Heyndrickxia sporothermodurans]
MLDYLRRLLIVLLMALCVTIIIFGGRAQAANIDVKEDTLKWSFPAKGEISDIYDSRGGIHKGLDIAGKFKSAVYAVEAGKVIRSYYSQSYGNVVFIHHSNGYETIYAHLYSRNVTEGDKVKRGDKIGLMGNTGNSTGTHLHFEVHQGEWTIEKENAIDPFLVFGKGEIGQFVFAQNHDPYGVVDVGGKIKESPSTTTSDVKPIADEEMISIEPNENEKMSKKIKIVHKHVVQRKGKIYIVKIGDTLSKISREYKISVKQLQKQNKIKNKNLIFPNQKIIIKRKAKG